MLIRENLAPPRELDENENEVPLEAIRDILNPYPMMVKYNILQLYFIRFPPNEIDKALITIDTEENTEIIEYSKFIKRFFAHTKRRIWLNENTEITKEDFQDLVPVMDLPRPCDPILNLDEFDNENEILNENEKNPIYEAAVLTIGTEENTEIIDANIQNSLNDLLPKPNKEFESKKHKKCLIL